MSDETEEQKKMCIRDRKEVDGARYYFHSWGGVYHNESFTWQGKKYLSLIHILPRPRKQNVMSIRHCLRISFISDGSCPVKIWN